MIRIIRTIFCLILFMLFVNSIVFADAVGTVTYMEGRADIYESAKGEYLPLVVGDKIALDDAVRTKSYSKAEVTLDDGSVLRIGSNSKVSVNKYDIVDGERKMCLINLERGELRAIVEKSDFKAPFDIATPNSKGSVVGSDVFVTYQSSATNILVSQGKYSVFNTAFPEDSVNIKAGKAVLIPHDSVPRKPRTFLPMEKRKKERDTSPSVRELDTFMKRGEQTLAVVERVAGDVIVKPKDALKEHRPVKNEVLNIGDIVITKNNGRIEIGLDNGHILEMRPNSQILIKSLARDSDTGDYDNLFEAKYGKIRAKLQVVKKGSKFRVNTPTAICGVRGTIMYLIVTKDSTKAFFEGGNGFIDCAKAGAGNDIPAGMMGECGADGIKGPRETTDAERDEFGSNWEDNTQDDVYGYSVPNVPTSLPTPEIPLIEPDPNPAIQPEGPTVPFDEVQLLPTTPIGGLVGDGTIGGDIITEYSADFNSDGVVDFRDYLIIKHGMGNPSPTFADGDANLDGVVDGKDLNIFSEQSAN